MASKKHAALIRKWLDGARIQYLNHDSNEWCDCAIDPVFNAETEYRVKPDPEPSKGYPQTKMAPGELGAELVNAMIGAEGDCAFHFSVRTMDRLVLFANAILKRAVDDGTVPTLEVYQQLSRELLEAEKLLESEGYKRTMNGEWEAPMVSNREARDKAIAVAVREGVAHTLDCYGANDLIVAQARATNIHAIIAGVK